MVASFQAGCKPASPNIPVVLILCVSVDFRMVSRIVVLFPRSLFIITSHVSPLCITDIFILSGFSRQRFGLGDPPFLRSGASAVQGERANKLIARLTTLSSY